MGQDEAGSPYATALARVDTSDDSKDARTAICGRCAFFKTLPSKSPIFKPGKGHMPICTVETAEALYPVLIYCNTTHSQHQQLDFVEGRTTRKRTKMMYGQLALKARLRSLSATFNASTSTSHN